MHLLKIYILKSSAAFLAVPAFLFFSKVNAQNNTAVTIKGTVLSKEDSIPLSNVTIKWKAGKSFTITDAQGNFRLILEDSIAVLVASYIGYNSLELKVKRNAVAPPFIITLEKSIASLSDVVVNTGYQKLPKERATGSFTVLNKEQLNKKTDATILGRMDGLTNSVLFDKNSNRPPVTVRGFSTINGPKAPLIVVDNFAYEGDINNINPGDIESITILKDAAAASIWGTKAGNGVIVITTRKAKFDQPVKVALSSTITVSAMPALSYYKQMSSADFIDVEKYLYGNNFYAAWINDISKPALSPVEEILIEESAGTITHQQANAQINVLKSIDVRNDFNKYLYQNAFDQQYNLNVSSGTAKMNYIVSAGYNHNTDMLSANYARWNFRTANVFTPVKKLQLSTSIAYTQRKNTTGKPGYNTMLIGSKKLYPYAQLADTKGNALPLYNYRQTYIDTAGGGKLLDWKYYPLDDWKHNATETLLQDVLLNVGVQYEIMHGLVAEFSYQYEKQQVNTQNIADKNSFEARDLINRFSEIDNTTGAVSYILPYGGISENSYSMLAAYNARGQLNYHTYFNNHEIVAIAGAEIKQLHTKSSNYRDYGYDENAGTLTRVDYTHPYPTFINGSTDFIPFVNSTGGQLNRYTSLFSNVAYTYGKKYTLSASVRKDASNLFGVRANDKGVPLWSAGAAWHISHEKFYHAGVLPYLNLRASYGFSGNVDNSTSAVTALYALGADLYTGLPTSSVYKFPNPDLTWERVKTINIGFDFELKSKALTGSIDYYIKKGLDLFGLAPLDYTSGLGVQAIVKNVASMKSTGIDVALTTSFSNRAVKWFQTFNFSYNASKVTSYYFPSDQGSFYVGSGNTIIPLTGQPIYAISSYKWGGLEHLTGNPQGYLNGELSTNYTAIMGSATKISDLTFSGSAVPTFFGNFLNTISFKDFSLTANFTYKLGYYFHRESINYDGLFNNWQSHTDYILRWQKPGDENTTSVPSMIYPYEQLTARSTFYATSSVLATRGDHVRLQFLSLAYSITKKRLKKFPVENIECTVNANNLGIIWRANNYGIDPDYPGTLTSPPPAGISLGLRINF